MACRILTAAAVLVALAGIAAPPALSDPIAQSHCSRSNRGLACRYEYEGRYSNITTYCAADRRGSHCETERTSKPATTRKIPEPLGPPPEGKVDPALYGDLPNPNDPAELRRQRERGAREDASVRRTGHLIIH